MSGAQGQPGQGVLDWVAHAGQLISCSPGRDLYHHSFARFGGQDDSDDVRIRDLASLAGDQLQRLLALSRQQLPGDLGRRLQPVLSALRLLVKPGILDRDAGCRREGSYQFLVVGGEFPAVDALSQVEVAKDLATDKHGHAQETGHGRVMRREPDRSRVVLDGPKPNRPGIVDQGAEEAFTLRQMPDPRHGPLVQPDVHELSQSTVWSKYPKRSVPRSHQLAPSLHDAPQHGRQGQVSGDRPVGGEQAPQPALSGQHLLGPNDDLGQQLIQLQARRIREHEPTRIVGALVRFSFTRHRHRPYPPSLWGRTFAQTLSAIMSTRRRRRVGVVADARPTRSRTWGYMVNASSWRSRAFVRATSITWVNGLATYPWRVSSRSTRSSASPLRNQASGSSAADPRSSRHWRIDDCVAVGNQPIPRVSKSRIGISSPEPASVCGTAAAGTPSRRRASSVVQARSSARYAGSAFSISSASCDSRAVDCRCSVRSTGNSTAPSASAAATKAATSAGGTGSSEKRRRFVCRRSASASKAPIGTQSRRGSRTSIRASRSDCIGSGSRSTGGS